MSEYRIEKVRQRVTITLAGGAVLTGDIFLQPTARYRTGPQDPLELFNEPELFLPLAIDGDANVLVSKEQVSRVQFAREAADTELDGVPGADVEITFADGATVSGELRFEGRTGRPRLLDFLNNDHQSFLTLRSPADVWLVNRRQIAQVRHRR